MQQHMTTLNKQTSLFTEEELTSLRAASHVNHIPRPDESLERRTSAIYGRRCLEQYKKLNRGGSWAKTFPDLLVGQTGWFSTRCRLTWNLKGTKSGRLYFRLLASTPHTDATGFGLLPTPRANQVNGCNLNSEALATRNKGNLEEVVAKWVRTLPTPCVRDMRGGCIRKLTRLQTASLSDAIHHVMNQEAGKTSYLNPRFVAEMMGFPTDWTELPFQNGEPKA